METQDDPDRLTQLQSAVDSDPTNPSHHFNLALLLLPHQPHKSAEHFVAAAKLDPTNAPAFRFLGHYYSRASPDPNRAAKCYHRALALNPNDAESGESLCDLLELSGKRTLEVSACRQAAEASPKAFWAFRRLGYLQVRERRWFEAVQSLQNAIRGYPTCAELWEALGLAYHRLGMLTAALKSYGRAVELEGESSEQSSCVFALVESGNVLVMLGNFRKGVENFRLALKRSPDNAAAQFGLASGLLALGKECVGNGAFQWGASLLEEAGEVVKATTRLMGNSSCAWKLHGDIQLAFAKCFPWMDGSQGQLSFEAFKESVLGWRRKCLLAAISANRSYQRALHLTPWQANIYIDIAVAIDLICSLEEKSPHDTQGLPGKMSLGGLVLEEDNSDFWVVLGCLSSYNALKQHALIRSLQLDVSLATAWAYLGKFYRNEGEKLLMVQAFDHARSIDPSLALPWAGMAADIKPGESVHAEAYESCLRAVQILPLAEFQVGLGKLSVLSGHLLSPQVFGAIRQAVQHAPHFPESHNLNGLISEARSDYQSAVAAYRLARCALHVSEIAAPKPQLSDISVNLARALCLSGDALDAARECEELKKEGLLDGRGLQIHAISLWQLGKNDLALSAVRNLAASISKMDRSTAATSISFIFKMLYRISGQESTMTSILKMPRELLKSAKISFVVSVLDALDHGNQLKPVVASTRESLTTYEEICGMHTLIALSKSMRQGEDQRLGIQSGIYHLRKILHMYPGSSTIRNQLGYLLLCSKEWKHIHTAARCIHVDPPGHPVQCLRSARETLGAAGIACSELGSSFPKFSFPSCKDQFMHGAQITQQLQKWYHQEPWNHNARYLLLLNLLQRAREERYPKHLCVMIQRVVCGALSSEHFSGSDVSYNYQKFQLLLCASEISLQSRDYTNCIKYAARASQLPLPDNTLFFAHLLLCRAYGAQGEFPMLREEYAKCLCLKTVHPVGWICLKFLASRYRVQIGLGTLDSAIKECLKEKKSSKNIWIPIFDLVQCQCLIWDQKFEQVEEIMKSWSFPPSESCLSLYHGAICMQLARKNCSTQIIPLAVRSLTKAQETSPVLLPFVSALLAQAEASIGSKKKWQTNLRHEWFSWPPEMRPAELYFQMYLLAKQQNPERNSSYDWIQSSKWIRRAIHLNPSCLRYWKLFVKDME